MASHFILGKGYIIGEMFTRPVLTTFTIDLSGAQYQNLSSVTFRIFTYLPGGGRSIEYHNVTINGTVQ